MDRDIFEGCIIWKQRFFGNRVEGKESLQRVVDLGKEDCVCELWVFLLEDFELPFDLGSGLAHFSSDDAEVTSICFEELNQGLDIALTPKTRFWLVFARFFVLPIAIVSSQLDRINESREHGTRRIRTLTVLCVPPNIYIILIISFPLPFQAHVFHSL